MTNGRRNTIKLLLLGSLSIALLSCETVSYYTQAARGQLSIMMGRQSIERLLDNPSLAAETRHKFELVLDIRKFAENELHLPVNDNFATYVEIPREHVVWNVFAAPEFSTESLTWCYPVAGCVAYRGYFSEARASRYASRLSDEGYDVYTGGVDAYSTLGWFDDSLLSTVLDRADYQLANLIFHELAHQVVYLAGDTTFNESFATAVAREGVRRWLSARGQGELQQTAELNSERQDQFVSLVTTWRDRFATLYDESLDEEQMRERKQQLQEEFREAYYQLRGEWGEYGGYDTWFANSLNNAQLSTVGSYNDLVPAFDQLLMQMDGELARFYDEVAAMAELPDSERNAALDSLSSD